MKKEKLIYTVLVVLMVFFSVQIVFCQGSKSREEAINDIILGYAGWYLADPFQVAQQQAVLAEAERVGIKYLTPTDARNDAAQQVTNIQTLVSKGANAIIALPRDTRAIMPAIKYCNERNIPVVCIDMGPEEPGAYITIRADNLLMGQKAADWVGETLQKADIGKKAKVLDLQGDLAQSNGRDRTEGFEMRIAKAYPDIEVIGRPVKWESDLAADATQTVLSTDPEIDTIYMQSDAVFLAPVLNTLKSMGLKEPVGHPDHIFLISIDGTPFGLEKIRSKELDALISQPLDMYAKYGIQYLIEAHMGIEPQLGPTDHNSVITYQKGVIHDFIPSPLVTLDNVDSPNLWGNMIK